MIVDGTEHWTTNLHIIRTGSPPGHPQVTDVQSCIECHCLDGTPSDPHGAIGCCPDHGYCWSAPGCEKTFGLKGRDCRGDKHRSVPVIAPKAYFLQYTVVYSREYTEDMAVTMISFDATSPVNNPTKCAVEYQVPALAPGAVHTLATYFTLKADIQVIFVEGHQHIGGINLTVGVAG